MKFFLLIGGTGGLLLSLGASLFAGNEILVALRDGAFGCIAGALLMRGFSAVFVQSVKELATQRAKERFERNQASTN